MNKIKQVDENLVQKILTKLLDQGRIKGRFVGRGDAATFVPQCYAEFQVCDYLKFDLVY